MAEETVSAVKVYEETCESIRKTDDISFKLIGLIPLLSGGTIVALLGSKANEWIGGATILWLAFFAAFSTLAVFRWELRNIQTCDWLRERALQLEKSVFKDETLLQRPDPPSWVGESCWFRKSRFGKSRFGMKFGTKFGKTEAAKCTYWITVLAWLSFPMATPRFWDVPPQGEDVLLPFEVFWGVSLRPDPAWLVIETAYVICAVIIGGLATLSLFAQVNFKHSAWTSRPGL